MGVFKSLCDCCASYHLKGDLFGLLFIFFIKKCFQQRFRKWIHASPVKAIRAAMGAVFGFKEQINHSLCGDAELLDTKMTEKLGCVFWTYSSSSSEASRSASSVSSSVLFGSALWSIMCISSFSLIKKSRWCGIETLIFGSSYLIPRVDPGIIMIICVLLLLIKPNDTQLLD